MTRVIDRTRLTNPDCYNNRPAGPEGVISAILLHHTGGRDSLLWLSGGHGVSIHKLFSKDGTIYKIVPEAKRAWHAGISAWGGRQDWNNFSLGYEIENMGDGKDPYTAEQYESIAQSIAYDTNLYNMLDYWVRDHKEVALPPGRKNDPDPSFSHWRVWRRVHELRAQWPSTWPAQRVGVL